MIHNPRVSRMHCKEPARPDTRLEIYHLHCASSPEQTIPTMALTDHCALFGSFHEDGFNRIVGHIQQQRPSLFNYATADLVGSDELYCQSIEAHPAVDQYGNLRVTISPFLPIPGYTGPYGMSYVMQLSGMKLDIHPGNSISLPPQLNPPLKEQHLAIMGKFCVGLGCPDRKYLDRIVREEHARQEKDRDKGREIPGGPEKGLPFGRLTCFCLEIYGVLHLERNGNAIDLKLDGLEIVDIKPEGLENGLECYLAAIIRLSLLPRLRLDLNDLVFSMGDFISIGPTPISGNVPANPSLADDKISVFLNLI